MEVYEKQVSQLAWKGIGCGMNLIKQGESVSTDRVSDSWSEGPPAHISHTVTHISPKGSEYTWKIFSAMFIQDNDFDLLFALFANGVPLKDSLLEKNEFTPSEQMFIFKDRSRLTR